MEENVVFGALAIPYKMDSDGYKFLLLKHQSGMWTLPGGGKDDEDASIEDCLVRELKEEIGLSIDASLLRPTGLVNRFTYGPEKPARNGMKGETHFWLIEMTGNEELSSWDNIVDHGWFDSDKIVQLLPFPDERKIFLKAIRLLN